MDELGGNTHDSGGAATAVRDAAGNAKDTMSNAAGNVTEQASDKARKAREQALEAADKRREQVAGKAHDVTNEVEKVADTLREDGYDAPARVIETVARQFDDLVTYVEQTSVSQMLEDANRQMRDKPLAFVGTALGLGIVASRLLRAGVDSSSSGTDIDRQPALGTTTTPQLTTTSSQPAPVGGTASIGATHTGRTGV